MNIKWLIYPSVWIFDEIALSKYLNAIITWVSIFRIFIGTGSIITSHKLISHRAPLKKSNRHQHNYIQTNIQVVNQIFNKLWRTSRPEKIPINLFRRKKPVRNFKLGANFAYWIYHGRGAAILDSEFLPHRNLEWLHYYSQNPNATRLSTNQPRHNWRDSINRTYCE